MGTGRVGREDGGSWTSIIFLKWEQKFDFLKYYLELRSIAPKWVWGGVDVGVEWVWVWAGCVVGV